VIVGFDLSGKNIGLNLLKKVKGIIVANIEIYDAGIGGVQFAPYGFFVYLDVFCVIEDRVGDETCKSWKYWSDLKLDETLEDLF